MNSFNKSMKCVSKFLWAAAVCVFLLGATSVETKAATLYWVTFGDQLITIDTTTGAGTLVGSLDTGMAAFGLSDRAGALYTFDQTADVVVQLDPATGASLATFNIGVTTVGEGGIAFRSDGIGFLSRSAGSTGILWDFDITGPSNNLVDSSLNPSMDGLDFDGSDVLFGLSQSSGDLYTINQTTGVTTFIGDPGVSASGLGGLTFSDGGVLFAAFNAQYTLGLLYAKGEGVPQDYVEAREWWLKAAEQGDASAQYNLGIYYHNGQGVPQDYVEARKWYLKAAEQGHADAQFNLGSLYSNGQGVPQDYVTAYAWANIAAVQGDETAKRSRDLLSAELDPTSLVEAQKLSTDIPHINFGYELSGLLVRNDQSLSIFPHWSKHSFSCFG